MKRFVPTERGDFWAERMGYLEPAKRPRSKSKKARLERWWRGHVRSFLQNTKRHFDAGHVNAMWDAVIFCERIGEPWPAWLRPALATFAQAAVNGRAAFWKTGRRSNPQLDLQIYEEVNELLESRPGTTKDKAYEEVREKLNLKYLATIDAMRKAYRRGEKVSRNPDSRYVSPFLELPKE